MSLTFKKIGSLSIISASLLAASGAVMAASNSSTAAVTVTATVMAKTCTPSWTDGAASLALGNVSAADMATKGDVSAKKTLTLTLSDCDSGLSAVDVTATGTADGTDAFANSVTTGGATGVGVKFMGGSSDTALKPDASNSVTFPIKDGAGSMQFAAQLINDGSGTDGKVGAGDVSSVVTLSMAYK